MADSKFTVGDNHIQHSEDDEIEIRFRANEHMTRVWEMSFNDLVDLQHTIMTFMAGERG